MQQTHSIKLLTQTSSLFGLVNSIVKFLSQDIKCSKKNISFVLVRIPDRLRARLMCFFFI